MEVEIEFLDLKGVRCGVGDADVDVDVDVGVVAKPYTSQLARCISV